MEQDVKEKQIACEQQAKKLTALRQKAAKAIEKEMAERLVPLGIPNVRFEVSYLLNPCLRMGQIKSNSSFQQIQVQHWNLLLKWLLGVKLRVSCCLLKP